MIATILDWWNNMNVAQQIYWAIAIAATILFVIQVIVAFIGLESHIESDALDATEGFSLFSLRSVLGFVVFFGWGGVASLSQGISPEKTVMVAFLAGFLAMIGIAYTFSQILKLQDSGNINLNNAIGKEAEVYIPIPPNKSGTGAISMNISNKLMEFAAMTTEKETLRTGAKVIVAELIKDNVMIVSFKVKKQNQ